MWQIISIFISAIFISIGVFAFGKIVINEEIKVSKKELIVSFLLITIFTEIIYLNFTGTLKTFLMIILYVFFYKYVFKILTKKSILLGLLYIVFLIIAELIELFVATKIIGISINYYYNIYVGSIIGNFITELLFIIVTFLMRKIVRKIINSKIEDNVRIIILSILTFTSIVMFFYTFIKEFKITNDAIMYLITMIVLISILFSLIKQVIENNRLTNEYDKLLEFMTTYEHEIEKQRVLRHETKNEFLTIRGKIEDNQKNKEIVDYINEILKDKIEVKQEEYAKFGYLPANGIKGLCYLKFQEAQDKGINTSINISKRIKNSNIYKLDTKQQRNLGKILGVLLDNAIEASLDSNDKKLGIEVYLINKECQIIISNSYNKNKPNKISNNKLSSKGKNRGHGLLLVKYITEHSNMFEVTTNITDKLYSQKITVKKT